MAHADDAGKYEIDAPPLTRLQVKAQRPHAGTATLTSVLEVLEDPIRGVDIEFKDGVQIAGRVVTPDGKPAPNSGVEVYADRGSSVVTVAGFGASSLSDHEGRFVLREVRKTNVRIVAGLSGYAASNVHSADLRNGAPQEEITLVLKEGHFVSGRVKHADGTPAASAHVSAISRTAPGMPPMAITDADGTFRLEGLAAGTVDLTANTGSAGSEEKRAGLKDVALDRDDIELILESEQPPPPGDGVATTGNVFVGHVVDWKTGEPVPDFTVSGLTAAPEPSPDPPGRVHGEKLAPLLGPSLQDPSARLLRAGHRVPEAGRGRRAPGADLPAWSGRNNHWACCGFQCRTPFRNPRRPQRPGPGACVPPNGPGPGGQDRPGRTLPP
ncbi:MAG: carboxypeptidase regulatory-like domain-containing protein [Gemmatimonadetes bacterium]|nr:carboxypeptidase regulatory-like domain-containing protein [Gemmatimonadota bacterium]